MVRSIHWNGRKHYGTSSSRQRHDYARHPSSNTGIASFDRGAEPRTRHQSEDRREVAKWAMVEDLRTAPKEPRSTVPTEAEEAVIAAFRRHTLLPLDDCFCALQPSIPHLQRSAPYGCLQQHGFARLPYIDLGRFSAEVDQL
jgi:hypothetical protein